MRGEARSGSVNLDLGARQNTKLADVLSTGPTNERPAGAEKIPLNILFLSSYAVIRILGSGSGLTTER